MSSGLIEAEELQRVVLVGHSYAGNLITCVADRLERSRPGLLQAPGLPRRRAFPTPVQQLELQPHAPETVAKRVAAVESQRRA